MYLLICMLCDKLWCRLGWIPRNCSHFEQCDHMRMLDKKVFFWKFSRHHVQRLAEFKLFLIFSIIDYIWMIIEKINKASVTQLTTYSVYKTCTFKQSCLFICFKIKRNEPEVVYKNVFLSHQYVFCTESNIFN